MISMGKYKYNSIHVCVCVRVVCNFLSSVSMQQKFEAADQCYSYVTAQFK